MKYTSRRTLDKLALDLEELRRDMRECSPSRIPTQPKMWQRWINTVENFQKVLDGVLQAEPGLTPVTGKKSEETASK